jgi:hypothetical protein
MMAYDLPTLRIFNDPHAVSSRWILKPFPFVLLLRAGAACDEVVQPNQLGFITTAI